jgi:cellulose biosynthesis protein BcsQ
MHTVAMYSFKGGVGKSALTVFLAEFLASKLCDNKRVLVVDLDPQRSSSTTLLGDDRWLEAARDGKTLVKMLRRQLQKPLTAQEARLYLKERPAARGSGRFHFLQSIQVITSEREEWYNFNDELADLAKANGNTYLTLLRDALSALGHDFDICLIDFPGHDRGPLVCCGLRAADRWLFPVVPDRMSLRDLDGTRSVLRRAFPPGSPHQIRGLGPVISICQVRNSNEYKKAKVALRACAEKRQIPKLFSADAEICHSTDAKNALDEVLRPTTLNKKFGETEGALFKSLRTLSREILERLHLPLPKAEEVETDEPVNALVTASYAAK